MISRATRYLPALRLRYSIVANISKKLLHTENGFIAIDEIRNPSKVALAYDVMLQDSSPKDIVYLAKQFGIEHTGASQRPKTIPIEGLVYILYWRIGNFSCVVPYGRIIPISRGKTIDKLGLRDDL